MAERAVRRERGDANTARATHRAHRARTGRCDSARWTVGNAVTVNLGAKRATVVLPCLLAP